jgi:hypothetical protein
VHSLLQQGAKSGIRDLVALRELHARAVVTDRLKPLAPLDDGEGRLFDRLVSLRFVGNDVSNELPDSALPPESR